MSGMGHKSGTTFVKILHQFKRKKNKSHHCCEMLVEAMLMPESHSVVELWMRSCFLKHAK